MADAGVGYGDRAIHHGLGRTGKQFDVIAARTVFANIRFDDGRAMLVLTKDLHPVPRRPPPMS